MTSLLAEMQLIYEKVKKLENDNILLQTTLKLANGYIDKELYGVREEINKVIKMTERKNV